MEIRPICSSSYRGKQDRSLGKGELVLMYQGRMPRQFREFVGYIKENYMDWDIVKEEIGKIIEDEGKTIAVVRLIQEMVEEKRREKALRQAEGILAAKARGIKFGRPKKPLPKSFGKVYKLYRSGELTAMEAASVLGLNRSTFQDMVKRYEAEGK